MDVALDMLDHEPSVLLGEIVCRFGEKVALNRVNLSIDPGEIHALLGPNGAGKTTLIRVLCGLIKPQTGTVFTTGRVGFVPSGDRSFYLRLSAEENLIFFARLHGLRLRDARRRARDVLDAVGLADVARRPVGQCSHGMQKRLSVARAIIPRPQILLVDEATHDLDPEGARRIRNLVATLAGDGTAVLWTTQRVDEVPALAQSATLLLQGSVVFTGSPTELEARAPRERYVLRVCTADTGEPPSPAAIELAAGAGTRIVPARDPGYFVLAPSGPANLGIVVARLVAAGFNVFSCRQTHSEMEEAFLSLTGAIA